MILHAHDVGKGKRAVVLLNEIDISQDCYQVDTEAGVAYVYVRDPVTCQFKIDPVTNRPISRRLAGKLKVRVDYNDA